MLESLSLLVLYELLHFVSTLYEFSGLLIEEGRLALLIKRGIFVLDYLLCLALGVEVSTLTNDIPIVSKAPHVSTKRCTCDRFCRPTRNAHHLTLMDMFHHMYMCRHRGNSRAQSSQNIVFLIAVTAVYSAKHRSETLSRT